MVYTSGHIYNPDSAKMETGRSLELTTQPANLLVKSSENAVSKIKWRKPVRWLIQLRHWHADLTT